MKKRINCYSAGCSRCSNGVFVRKSFFGEDLYSCSAYKRKHKHIDAKDCKDFRCSTPEKFTLCRNCRKGK